MLDKILITIACGCSVAIFGMGIKGCQMYHDQKPKRNKQFYKNTYKVFPVMDEEKKSKGKTVLKADIPAMHTRAVALAKLYDAQNAKA